MISERRSPGSRSILLTTSSTGVLRGSSVSTFSSSGPYWPASTTNSTRSTDDSVEVTARLSERFSALACRVWKPGVSTNTYWVSSVVWMPTSRWRVVCALREVMLIFWPTSALTRVDLPTLGRPTMATVPQRNAAGGFAAAESVDSGCGRFDSVIPST